MAHHLYKPFDIRTNMHKRFKKYNQRNFDAVYIIDRTSNLVYHRSLIKWSLSTCRHCAIEDCPIMCLMRNIISQSIWFFSHIKLCNFFNVEDYLDFMYVFNSL